MSQTIFQAFQSSISATNPSTDHHHRYLTEKNRLDRWEGPPTCFADGNGSLADNVAAYARIIMTSPCAN